MTIRPENLRVLSLSEKKELLGRLLAKKRAKRETYPLSFTQERLWFLYQLRPDSPAYNVPLTIPMNANLDNDALERTLNEIARRHQVLRTSFKMEDRAPVQVIGSSTPVRMGIEDFRHLSEEQRKAEVSHYINEQMVRPMDLLNGPLWQANLLLLNQQFSWLFLKMHHIVFDGWSQGIFVNELTAIYMAFAAGKPSPMPELTYQYSDFSLWQRSYLQGERLDKLLHFWVDQFKGAPPVLELPCDRPRPLVESFSGATRSFHVSSRVARVLNSLSKERGLTLFMTLVAAFKILLYRYTGVDDLIIGTPVANRTRPEIENLIGCFINTLVLRTKVSAGMRLHELLSRVQKVTLDAFSHQELPVELLVKQLEPERAASHNPIFQVVFVLQNAPTGQPDGVESAALSPAEARPVTVGPIVGTGTAKFDITVIMAESPQGLDGWIEYSTDLFDPATIERLILHYGTVLEAITSHLDQPLATFPILPPDEYRQIMVTWNDTDAAYPSDVPLHQLVEEQVVRSPDAVAIVGEDITVTYAQMNRTANCLARHLRKRGVGSDQIVAVYMERCVPEAIAFLAILKAGATYLPLDPDHPHDRVSRMLDESETRVLLIHTPVRGAVPPTCATIVDYDEDLQRFSRYDPTNLNLPIEPLMGSFAIYTSGSTGQPKGMVMNHRGLNNFLYWMQQNYPLAVGDHFLHRTAAVFDPSIWETMWSFISGASLVVPNHAKLRDNAYLIDLICRKRVSLGLLVASALQVFVEEKGVEKCSSLRHFFTGGEAVALSTAQRFHDLFGPFLHNIYGPAEATISVCVGDCEPRTDVSTVPIGRPVYNTQIYLLDKYFQPVPTGIPGELFIGGVLPGRGYIKRPGQTAERFIPDPFGKLAGARLYRTGDLARHRDGGVIEFMGRNDSMIKIRGFRIEIAEIETALKSHPNVREVAVVVHRRDPHDLRLIAHLSLHQAPQPEVFELKNFLSEKLPEYMIPAYFMFHDSLPKTTSDKVDRKALPVPELGRSALKVAYVSPSTPTQAVLAGIWREVLRISRVGIHDSFFELGGHSLTSVQVITRVREKFGIELPLHNLFKMPTISLLADWISKQKPTAPKSELPMVKVSRDRPLPQSYSQERLWFLDRFQPGNPFYNLVATISLEDPVDLKALGACLTEMVRRHETLRTTFSRVEGQPVQVIGPAYKIELVLRETSGLDIFSLATREALIPFDLERGPVLRAGLFKTSADGVCLVLTMHHIVCDAWSTGILMREIQTLYQAFRQGLPSPLPDLPFQFADYASWQREVLKGEVLENLFRFWRRELEGAPPLIDLPIDRPRPAIQTYRGETLSFLLPPELAQAIQGFAKQERVTLFMVLMAAFQALLARYVGNDDIVVGSPMINRSRKEIEGLIGFFANTLVFRTDLSGNPSFRQLAARVKRVTLGVGTHQDLPFEKLVAELEPERDTSRHPLFQVMLALQNASTMPTALSEKASLKPDWITDQEPRLIDTGTAKFDMTLFLQETEQTLMGALEYNTDLFDEETIVGFKNHFITLLSGVIAQPDKGIDDVQLLTDEAYRQLLEVLATPVMVRAADTGIHQLFEAQADRTPEATALVYSGSTISYQKLEERANRLAAHLIAQGVGPEVAVGIVQTRLPAMVVAVLAVLKAGGVCLPLDPTYPKTRRNLMIAEAGALLVLTDDAQTAGEWEVPFLEVAGRENPPKDREVARPGLSIAGNQAAYLLYTSGSTGKPKGVSMSHGAFANLLNWEHCRAHPEARRTLNFAPLSFDVFFQELFTTLGQGGSLVLVPEEIRRQPRLLLELVVSEMIERLFLPFVALEQMANEAVTLGVYPKQMREVITAGEQLRISQTIRTWFQGLPHCRLFNQYGPTETHVATQLALDEDASTWPLLPSVGKPVDGFGCLVLNRSLQPVPSRGLGLFFLGGLGLARGYAAQPAHTAERFIPDPFSREPGARLYNSGDLARPNRDGSFDFCGRSDGQLKVRGFRIEPGEVETLLAEHPGVEQVAVVAKGDHPGNRTLVAYVVRSGQQKNNPDSLRLFLKERLPSYMVPAGFFYLNAMPVTPNGKLDRRALKAMARAKPALTERFVPPSNETQHRLVQIWAQVLGMKSEQIGIRDNFFSLGGHSLMATQVASRIRKHFGVELMLPKLFEAPTIAELTLLIEPGTSAVAKPAQPAAMISPH